MTAPPMTRRHALGLGAAGGIAMTVLVALVVLAADAARRLAR